MDATAIRFLVVPCASSSGAEPVLGPTKSRLWCVKTITSRAQTACLYGTACRVPRLTAPRKVLRKLSPEASVRDRSLPLADRVPRAHTLPAISFERFRESDFVVYLLRAVNYSLTSRDHRKRERYASPRSNTKPAHAALS